MIPVFAPWLSENVRRYVLGRRAAVRDVRLWGLLALLSLLLASTWPRRASTPIRVSPA